MRAPVMPKGWPSAIAPPCGLSLSPNGSTPMPRAEGMTWAANASLISTMSMSSMVIFARLSACLDASIGPRPMNSGSSADVQRAGVAGGDRAVLTEGGLQRGQDLHGRPGPRAVVLGEGLAVGQGHGDDLAVEEAVVSRLDRGDLALDRVAVLLLARDLLPRSHVLRRLAHRDVDVGILLGVAGDELRVVGVWSVGVAAAVAGHALDADG